MNNVEFLWGENLSNTIPAVNQGQILFDKTTSTLHIDTEEGRQKVLDNTKNDLFINVDSSDTGATLSFVKNNNLLKINDTLAIGIDCNAGKMQILPFADDAFTINSYGFYRITFSVSELALSGSSKISGLGTDQIQEAHNATNKEYVDNRTSWIEW